MLTKLYPYQEQGVCILKQFNGRALLADAMGAGKSIQVIKYIVDTQSYPALIVVPASLKINWQREFEIHANKRADILSGGKPTVLSRSGERIYIINYDILAKWEKQIQKLQPKIIVTDECHYLKAVTANRTKVMLRLAKIVSEFIAVSGTPMTNHPTELYTILRMVLGEQGIESRREFCDRYSKIVLTKWGFRYDGSRRLPELHNRLKQSCMIRRLLKDVLPDLPEKTRQTIPIELPHAARKEYAQMEIAFGDWYHEKFPERSNEMSQSAVIMTKLGYMKRQVAAWKLPFLYEWIDNFLEESSDKLTIFGIHHRILDSIVDRYKVRGSARKPFVVKIDGTMDIIDRQQSVDCFQRLPETRIFVGQVKAAGVGITLTASHTVLFAECDFVPANHSQAENRALRIGQKNHVNCYYMIAQNTIEEHVADILFRKQKEFDAVMDGGKSGDEFNMIQELMKRLRQEKLSKLM